jgi:hypothetical protein
MPDLDIFNGRAFKRTSLTNAVNLLPRKPGRITSMNLFTPKPIRTRIAVVEQRMGTLSLVQTSEWGDDSGTTRSRDAREKRLFNVPHMVQSDKISAEDVQGMTADDTETELQTVAAEIADRQQSLVDDIEVTWEYHQAGALAGKVLDADGTTVIYDYYAEFGVTEVTVNFDFTAGAGTITDAILALKRGIEGGLGGTPHSGINVLCSDQWFDALAGHVDTKEAFTRWRDGEFFRTDVRAGFPFQGVFFENYSESIGAVEFLATGQARAFPKAPKIFDVAMAPADYMGTANTRGKRLYSNMERGKFDKYVELEVQSNPLHICNRPGTLRKLTGTF